MFGKRRQPTTDITVLGAGSALEGKLTVHGAVHIDGAISGSLSSDGHLSVGPGARILGEVHAENLSVRGKIQGIVRVRSHLHVLADGTVQGYARYATLEVERGGIMDGNASLLGESVEASFDEDALEAAE